MRTFKRAAVAVALIVAALLLPHAAPAQGGHIMPSGEWCGMDGCTSTTSGGGGWDALSDEEKGMIIWWSFLALTAWSLW